MSDPAPNRAQSAEPESLPSVMPGKALRLGYWSRWFAGGVGTLLGVAGAWAVVVAGKDGAGAVALILAALVLWLLALIGHVPYRLWGKDLGIEWGELGLNPKEAAIIADAVPAERREELLAAVEDAAQQSLGYPRVGTFGAARRLETAVHDAGVFEKQCRRIISRATRSRSHALPAGLQPYFDTIIPLFPGSLWDAYINTQYGHIFFQFTVALDGRTLHGFITRFHALRSKSDAPLRLIILSRNTDLIEPVKPYSTSRRSYPG